MLCRNRARQIFELLSTLGKEKIILFATHRYDTIRKADTIVVLVDERIAEIGAHDELEQNAQEFWLLFLAQSLHLLQPSVERKPG